MGESQQGFIVFAKGIGGFTAHLLVTNFPILIVDSEEQASGIIGALKDTGYSDLEFSFQPFTALDQIKRAGHEVVIDKALDGEYGGIARDLCRMAKEIFRRSGGRRLRDKIASGADTDTTSAGSTPTGKTNEGEGNGGAGTAPGQEQSPPSPTRESLLGNLEPADRKAYYTYAYAESNLETTTDRQAYQWLSDNGLPDERDSPELAMELTGYTLPSFPTWSKQVRNARRVLGEQKNTPRAGRSAGGGSIISASDRDCNSDAD